MSKIFVTGAAGFIGYHIFKRLLDRGDDIVGLDNLTDYYDVNLKFDRPKQIEKAMNFRFIKADIASKDQIEQIFIEEKFDIIINLAAQPEARYSLLNPYAYADSNIVGFLNVLEGCRHNKIRTYLKIVFIVI